MVYLLYGNLYEGGTWNLVLVLKFRQLVENTCSFADLFILLRNIKLLVMEKKVLYPRSMLNRFLIAGFVSCLLLLSGRQALAQQALVPQIDSMFISLNQKGLFNGNILIAVGGKPIYEKSLGYENFDTKQPLSAASVFELASCSKQFTAFAIALLQHQQKLNYTDDITRFIPELSFYKGITIDNLVHHTSGLPDYMGLLDSLWDKHKIAGNEDLIKMFARYRPAAEFEAGTRYEYSNTGYALLASIITRASGKSYAAYLDQYIFKPLKMDHSQVYNRRYKPRKIAHYAYDFIYDEEKKKFVSIDSIPEANMVYFLDGISGDGTVNTTTGDLLLWDRALYTDKLLPKKEMDLLFTPGKLKDGSATDYAFGWMIENNKELGKIAGHSGGWGGYRTYIERDMDKDRTIIILQNADRAAIPSKPLHLLLYGEPLPLQVARKEVKLEDKVLAQYTGAYELAPDFILTVTQKGNQLYAQATGQSELAIYPESEQKFFLKEVEAQLEFIKDDTGAVSKAILHQNGRAMDAQKIK